MTTLVDAPPPLEGLAILARNREHLPSFSLRGQPPMPVCLDALWIICLDVMDRMALLGELDSKFPLPPQRVARLANFVLAAGTVLQQIHVAHARGRVFGVLHRYGWLGGGNLPPRRIHIIVPRIHRAGGEDAGSAPRLRAKSPEHLLGRKFGVVPRRQEKVALGRNTAQTAGE